MFVVKTKLGPSTIHGVGVFADEDIPKGTVIWKLHENFDRSFTDADLKEMEPATRAQLLSYAYKDKFNPGSYVLCIGHAVFINHSYQANTGSKGQVEIALCDIKAGTELTSDYREWCDEFDPHVDAGGEMPLPAANGAGRPTVAVRL